MAFAFAGLSTANAQIKHTTMVVMYDRSTYVGEIVVSNDETLTMELTNGATITIPRNKIKSIKAGADKLFYNKGKFHNTKGYFFSLSLGFNPFIEPEEEEGPTELSEFLIGWRFNKDVSVAVGLGRELFSTQVAGFSVETVFNSYFLYGRYYLADWRQRPYVFGRVGYGSGPSQEFDSGRHTGGFQAQFGGGFHFASRRKSKFNISMGYHIQQTNGNQLFLDVFGNEVDVDYNLLIKDVFLKLTFEFR